MNIFLKQFHDGKIVPAIIFIISLIGFLFLDTEPLFKYSLLVLALVMLFLAWYKKNFEFLVYLSFFLGIFDFYVLYELYHWPLWIIMLLMLIFSGYLFNFLAQQTTKIEQTKNLFYSFFLAFIFLEIFLALLPWTTLPRTKSIIILASFYLTFNIINLSLKNHLTFQKIIPYLLISIILIILAITTTMWYAY